MDSLKQDLDVLVSWRRLNDDFKRLNQNYQDYIGDFYIFRIALSPEFQGRRLGIEIIEYAYEYSRKQASRLYLGCYYKNKNLCKFYTIAGLKYIGDFPEEDYFVSVFSYENI